MGHMVAGLDQDISWTRMKQSKVADGWIHLTGEAMFMDSMLVPVMRDIIITISNILIGGVRSSTFQRILRKPSILILMGMRRNYKMKNHGYLG